MIYSDNFKKKKNIDEDKIVSKILRSLPKQFHSKVIAIEESKDVDVIKVMALARSLQRYELTLSKYTKSKPIDLKTIEDEVELSYDD